MMISFTNTKGGVGKSTLAVHLAVWLVDRGFRVAVLDADKQRSSSEWIAEAEPSITVRTADTPETCLAFAQELLLAHDFVVGDGPAGLDDVSRTLLILSALAILPISPSILDLRSVQQATSVLRYAQGINGGPPEGRVVLNRMSKRGRISRELRDAAPGLGVTVATHVVRHLQAFVDAAQQGTTVTRMTGLATQAAGDVNALFEELLGETLAKLTPQTTRERRIAND